MLFNSIDYLLFFPIVVLIYYLIPHQKRWILLLVASYYFYMSWKAEYIVLIIISTIADYYLAIKIYNEIRNKPRKIYLSISLIVNLGILIGFKYFNFISENLNVILNGFQLQTSIPYLDFLLPVGISFYTFQTLSYTIDIYNGKIKPERHLGKFAVFVSFFPQLVAGPIERAKQLLPQFNNVQYLNNENIVNGLRRILWGLFKKVVIADRVAVIVNHIYNDPSQQNGLTLLIASYLFAFQIYCDFSGYSDIAIGSAKILGIKLMENFNVPYFAKSISEFWSRWHISLSTWFRDYLYIPLGGNRVSNSKRYINIFIVFVVSGIWHGANWTFVIWGAIHGGLLLIEKWLKLDSRKLSQLSGINKMIRVVVTFHLVVTGWVFFRVESIDQAVFILMEIISLNSWQFDIALLSPTVGNIPVVTIPKFILSLFFVCLLIIFEYLFADRKFKAIFFNSPKYLRWSVYYILILTIIIFGNHGNIEFIYFQF